MGNGLFRVIVGSGFYMWPAAFQLERAIHQLWRQRIAGILHIEKHIRTGESLGDPVHGVLDARAVF